MKTTRYIFGALTALLMTFITTGCIDDGVTTDVSAQPDFSTDTLKLGTVLTTDVTTTHRFTVINRNNKGISISDIRLSGAGAPYFRLNVDGIGGDGPFRNVEIRANDSIYVLVEATLPANGKPAPVDVEASIDFTTNGAVRHVIVTAQGQDVERLRAVTLTADTHFAAGRPYQVFDSLVVAKGKTLTLEAGTRIYFHDGAQMIVRGTLVSNGTVDKPVELCGDRTGDVITDISFDLMSRQWNGLQFTLSSFDNKLSHTCIRNTWYGVIVSGTGPSMSGVPKLTLLNCQLRNSGDRVLEAYNADIKAVGCEFGEAANGLVYLEGGTHTFNHCTLANYYLFSAIGGPALQLAHLNAATEADDSNGLPYLRANFSNCIFYGLGTDISHGNLDDTQVYLRSCLLKSPGSDDDHFVNCLWDADPLYYTVREDYIFDYRLRDDSPAIGAGDPALTLPEAAFDAYGLQRGSRPDIGAYVYVPSQQ